MTLQGSPWENVQTELGCKEQCSDVSSLGGVLSVAARRWRKYRACRCVGGGCKSIGWAMAQVVVVVALVVMLLVLALQLRSGRRGAQVTYA